MELGTKACGAFAIKSATLGEVEAVVATLNVVDRDAEVILPGAIPDGTPVKLSGYGHDAMFGAAPVGKGTLATRGEQVVFTGRFFMSTQRGLESFATLKELGGNQEWSFGFRVLESDRAPEAWARRGAVRLLKRLEPFEVSPVIVGAGIGTGTLSAKRADPGATSAAVAEELAKSVAREARLFGVRYPPPAEVMKFIAFAADRLAIPVERMPQIRMVSAFPNALQVGSYVPAKHEILVRANRKGLDLRRTLAHELAHAKEALDGREHSEAFAMTAAEEIVAAWRRFSWEDA